MSSPVIAVTRNGLGDFWSFENVQEVWDHALIQYGDVVMERQGDILRMYMAHEIDDLIERVCTDGDTRVRVEQLLRSDHIDQALSVIWAVIKKNARPAPTDPAFICEQVRTDRRTPTDRSKRGKNMTADAKEKKAKAAPRPPKYAPTAKISMGKDKDGKAYGKDNNPKRAGSASAGRFATYKDGLTVEAAMKAGVTTADLDHDTGKGFISVK